MHPEIVFSIIVPTFNRGSIIQETLHSVLEQIYFYFELIIVDDGSTDDTEEVLRPFLCDERIKYFKIKNSERGAARNFGIKKSKGDYVTFLDSDDIFLPWHLETAVSKIALASQPPIFHLSYEILHSNGQIDSMPLLPNIVNDKLIEGNFLSCMGVFLRKDIVFFNLFDEDRNLAGSEDYELWMRIAAHYPIRMFPDTTSRMIQHDQRSVVTTNPEKLISRISLLEEKLRANEDVRKRFGTRLREFSSFCLLYLSLHLALSNARWLALRKLIFAVRQYPLLVVNYRFIVALKKILLW